MKKRRIIIALVFVLFVGLAVASAVMFNYIKSEKFTQVVFAQNNIGEIGTSFSTINSNVKRNIPTQTQNEGLCARYPVYGTALPNITDEEKDNILKEDALLRVSDSTYTEIDKAGNLILNGQPTGKKLYKHTAAVGMYYGDVSNNEPAVSELITITPKEYRNYITGLYAPAGEVVKIEISQSDLSAIGGLVVCVGQTSLINKNNNIWKAKNNFCRMPNLGNFFTISKSESYVGNFLGGPIYVKPAKIGVQFSVKITGAVKYPCFVYGYTTKEEFEDMKNLSAPYFDFEIWDTGVRHSGPKSYANLNYDNLVKVADLWDKVNSTSRRVPVTSNASMSIGFVYDVFVAAGEACAFQGANWVNAPCYWFPLALDYQAITSSGFWGQIHEFNHHFQNYGIAPIIEVSNNATSLLSYVLYTNISANRSTSDSTLSGWNRYTDPTRSLRETLQNTDTQAGLNIYADILHTFGVDMFIKATKTQNYKVYTADAWYEALSKATEYNFTYYFENLIKQPISESVKELYNLSERKPFVPIAMLYQTGRNYYFGGKEYFSNTVKPYEYIKGENLILDFEKYTYLPVDYSWEIKSITKPQNGTLTKISDKKYSYSNKLNTQSGEFYVTVSLYNSGSWVDDVTFSLNLNPKDPKPTKTLYSYDSRVYNQTDDAVSANFAGFKNKQTEYTTSTFMNRIANNQIGVVEGKIYIQADGEYTICLRAGRGNHALYTSADGINYTKDIAFSGDMNTFDFQEKHIKKYTLKKGQYVYYRQVTISNGHSDAYTELGITNNSSAPQTISASVLYNKNAEGFKQYSFTSETKYARVDKIIESINVSEPTKQQIVSVNFGSWDTTTKIENILDGDSNTFYHNSQNEFVSEQNMFELVVDLGEERFYNLITFVGRKTLQLNLPCTFKLYAGLQKNDLALIGEYADLPIKNRTTTATFKTQNIRFYKIVVTDTKSEGTNYKKYVCFSEIRFDCVANARQQEPAKMEFYKTENTTFKQVRTPSTFGSVISGNGKIEYSFTGTMFGIFVRQTQTAEIIVEVNGKKTTYVLQPTNNKQLGFMLELPNKKHKITIFVQQGNLQIDSIMEK